MQHHHIATYGRQQQQQQQLLLQSKHPPPWVSLSLRFPVELWEEAIGQFSPEVQVALPTKIAAKIITTANTSDHKLSQSSDAAPSLSLSGKSSKSGKGSSKDALSHVLNAAAMSEAV